MTRMLTLLVTIFVWALRFSKRCRCVLWCSGLWKGVRYENTWFYETEDRNIKIFLNNVCHRRGWSWCDDLDLYSGVTWFEFRPGHLLYWLRFFVVFLSLQVIPRLCHGLFVLRIFQFLSYHSMLYSLDIEKTSLYNTGEVMLRIWALRNINRFRSKEESL
jgi:hypothetical protein